MYETHTQQCTAALMLLVSMIVVTDLCWYAHPCVMILINCVKICYNIVSETV